MLKAEVVKTFEAVHSTKYTVDSIVLVGYSFNTVCELCTPSLIYFQNSIEEGGPLKLLVTELHEKGFDIRMYNAETVTLDSKLFKLRTIVTAQKDFTPQASAFCDAPKRITLKSKLHNPKAKLILHNDAIDISDSTLRPGEAATSYKEQQYIIEFSGVDHSADFTQSTKLFSGLCFTSGGDEDKKLWRQNVPKSPKAEEAWYLSAETSHGSNAGAGAPVSTDLEGESDATVVFVMTMHTEAVNKVSAETYAHTEQAEGSSKGVFTDGLAQVTEAQQIEPKVILGDIDSDSDHDMVHYFVPTTAESTFEPSLLLQTCPIGYYYAPKSDATQPQQHLFNVQDAHLPEMPAHLAIGSQETPAASDLRDQTKYLSDIEYSQKLPTGNVFVAGTGATVMKLIEVKESIFYISSILKNLSFKEKPNYDYLKGLLVTLAFENKMDLEDNNWDWSEGNPSLSVCCP